MESRGGASRADVGEVGAKSEGPVVQQRLMGDCAPWSIQDDLGGVGVDTRPGQAGGARKSAATCLANLVADRSFVRFQRSHLGEDMFLHVLAEESANKPRGVGVGDQRAEASSWAVLPHRMCADARKAASSVICGEDSTVVAKEGAASGSAGGMCDLHQGLQALGGGARQGEVAATVGKDTGLLATAEGVRLHGRGAVPMGCIPRASGWRSLDWDGMWKPPTPPTTPNRVPMRHPCNVEYHRSMREKVVAPGCGGRCTMVGGARRCPEVCDGTSGS